jgi:hypothetical protein
MSPLWQYFSTPEKKRVNLPRVNEMRAELEQAQAVGTYSKNVSTARIT